MTASATKVVPTSAPASQPTVKYDFEGRFQSGVAALLCRDENFGRRSEGLIKPDYFEDPIEAQLVALALEHQSKYGTAPSTKGSWVQVLQDAKSAGQLREEVFKECVQKMVAFFKQSLSSREYALDKVSKFARHQALQAELIRAIDLMERSDFDAIEQGINKALQVGANSDFVDYDYFAQSEKREKHREDIAAGRIKKDGIPTGLKKLDKMLYHEGWGRKELSCVMGGAKKGKSMGLGYFAGRAALQGFNVLYATLEVSTDIIADRTDACLSSTDMSNLVADSGTVANKIKVLGDSKDRGELRLVNFASGTLTPKQLERVIERYRQDGILFDLIVVDYADIMAPNIYTQDAIENSKQIWLGLRAIADKENAAVLTATQTNREGYKESTAKAEHAAEDFNKIRIADIVLSINRTEEEKDNGEARLFFAANRNGAGEFTLHIKQDLSKMHFITKIVATS